jgi:hypothetical protein
MAGIFSWAQSRGRLEPAVDCREHEQRENRAGDEPADHHRGQGPLHLGARAPRNRHRHEAERAAQGGHEHRPEPVERTLEHGRPLVGSRMPQVADGLDEHGFSAHSDSETLLDGRC